LILSDRWHVIFTCFSDFSIVHGSVAQFSANKNELMECNEFTCLGEPSSILSRDARFLEGSTCRVRHTTSNYILPDIATSQKPGAPEFLSYPSPNLDHCRSRVWLCQKVLRCSG
jgi:hypothetical protein